jgi:Tol biopolymer transport system component
LVLLALGAALVGCTAPPAETATSIRAEALGRETRPPQAGRGSLLYLAPDDQDNLQLQLLPLAANKPITLTQAPYGIMDYDVSGDGQIIVYSAWREDNGTDLWAVQIDGQHNRLLVPCENAACGRIAWMVTDNQFTYERHEGPEAQGAAALWLFDWEKQATQPLTIDNAEAGINLTWSPDGSWTSYFLPDKGVITVVHREDGRKYDLPNSLSDPVAWDPTGKTLVALEIKPDGNQTLAHLVQLDLTSGDRREIGTPRMADRQPAWSPTGDWLAVTRRDWTGKYPSKTQMWVMRRDGTEARAVLDDPDHQYLSPVWSPDGRFLVVQRYSNEQVFVQPEVWMVELATGQSTQVLPSAGQVTWLP